MTHPLVRDVLLLDGSTLRLRAPTPDDLDEIKRFYDELSGESRYQRFHGYLRTEVAARAYAEANGVDRVALIGGQGDRIVAAASYDLLREPGAAEVAFAVADDFRDRGTATRLLEQLAAVAAERGVKRFDADVLATNRAMIAVFEHAGFEVRRQSEFGEVTVSLDITPSDAVLERIDERDHIGAVASLRPLLAPRSIAVVGPSSAPGDLGAAVLASIMRSGFRGIATPVNANGEVVHSVRCARSLLDLDDVPELVIVTVVPEEVPVIAEQAATIGAKVLIVVTRDPDEGAHSGAHRPRSGCARRGDHRPRSRAGGRNRSGGRQAGLGRAAAFGVLPATDIEADELIDEAESVGRQLEGFPGSAKLDRAALRDLILRFALLLRNVPALAEVDLNPVRCMRAGCVVLDAHVRVGLHHVPERVKTW